MKLLNIIAVLITLSAFFGYVNSRFIELPDTIGTMFVSMIVSLGVFKIWSDIVSRAHLMMKRGTVMNRFIHCMFTGGVWTKGINGILEFTGETFVLVAKKSSISEAVLLTQQEQTEIRWILSLKAP